MFRVDEETKEKNKKLVERYPFLLPRNVFTDELDDYDYEYTWLDDMPKGWRIAFGEQMMEEIREDMIACNYLDDLRIFDIKEKYGTLCFDIGAYPSDSRIDDIILKYEKLSACTCIKCGKQNVNIVCNNGWWEPICKDCYEEEMNIRKRFNSAYGRKFVPTPYEALEVEDIEWYIPDKNEYSVDEEDLVDSEDDFGLNGPEADEGENRNPSGDTEQTT